MPKVKNLILSSYVLFAATASAEPAPRIPILSDPFLLGVAKIKALETRETLAVAYAEATEDEIARLQRVAHEYKRCGGFERLSSKKDAKVKFSSIEAQAIKAKKILSLGIKTKIEKRADIEAAVAKVSAENLQNFVAWYSSFPTRFHRSSSANVPVNALKDRISTLVTQAATKNAWVTSAARLELISHRSTQQNSIRLHIEGKERPMEIIALGAHLDSISYNGKAPGADDNASGTSNVFEAARILLSQASQPERSIEFFWYAGEESGLLGSAEIAKDYRIQKKDVVAVMQLDMSLFPGQGEGVISSMTDFTSPWLRNVIVDLNHLYVGATILEDKCGYGCSDHASWHSEGYPAVMPFEAGFDSMNNSIHSSRDIIDASSNFKHSALFTKLAVSMALELGNSTARSL